MSLAKLLTVNQAADALNTTPRFIRRLVAERRICFHHVGRHVRIAEADLEAFVEAGRVTPSDQLKRAAIG
jgi:excisionase family DNA binding protein